MAYLEKEINNGYNAYIDSEVDDMGTQMDVGLLVLDAGETYTYENDKKEVSFDLLEGEVTFEYGGEKTDASRRDCFHDEAYCLLAPRACKIVITAKSHAELYVQATICENDYAPVMYTPSTVQTQHAGSNGELMGTMKREIKTFYDYDNAPFSNMVLGEVLSYPGKWSSYPPHHHPQPEVYFYRFDHSQGFGAGFSNGEIHETHHNGMLTINHGFHSQVTAPGYALCYTWGIRHLDGNPWKKTRIDEEEHKWLWRADANDHIFQG